MFYLPFDYEALSRGTQNLLPLDPACPLCGSLNRTRICTLHPAPRIDLLHCLDCHASSASQFPHPQALVPMYQALQIRAEKAGKTYVDSARLGEHLASLIRQHLPPRPLRVLDFGGGNGALAIHLAQRLRADGFCPVDIVVVDLLEHQFPAVDAGITLSRRANVADTPSGQFDVVLASASIEHVVNIRDTLEELLARLAPAGVFYARTPYVVPVMKLVALVGLRWEFLFPMHLHDLGQHFWETYFRRHEAAAGCELLRSRPSPVQTSLREHFLPTLLAYLVKLPWYGLHRYYPLVGGWEVLARKRAP